MSLTGTIMNLNFEEEIMGDELKKLVSKYKKRKAMKKTDWTKDQERQKAELGINTKTKENEEKALDVIKGIMKKPENKTKAQLISDLTDLHQLYDRDVVNYTKKINDLTSDRIIKDEIIKELNEDIDGLQKSYHDQIESHEEDIQELRYEIELLELKLDEKNNQLESFENIILTAVKRK